MNPEVFIELSTILVITVIVTGLMQLLRQPAIIGYILSGIVAGPFLLDLIGSQDTFTIFSQIGVALLLFIVGLNLNPRAIKDVGKVALITGLGQIIFTGGIGFFIARLLGFDTTASFYLGVALAFSSTIIIMKLLSDKRDLETLYGRISIGFLIIQDLVAILLLLSISSLSNGTGLATLAVETILTGIGGILVLFVLTWFVLPRVTHFVAKSQEFLLLFSIGWCFAVAAVFHYLNFSIEAGALLAGMTLSLSPYHYEISSKLKPIRDFFLILFFITLGSQMVFSNVAQNITAIMVFSVFVLVGNPIIVMILMGSLGYTRSNSFLSGLTVAQISEFSLILVALGITAGHLGGEILSLVTAVGLITFAGSTYLILYSDKIFRKISPFLKIFERKGRKVDERKKSGKDTHQILLFGCNRVGSDIIHSISKLKKKFLIVDYDPQVIAKLSKSEFDCRYGDASDQELLDQLNFSKAKMVISTIPLIDTNIPLIRRARKTNKKSIVAVVSNSIEDAFRLYDEGATYVIMPNYLGGQHFSTMIEKNKMSMDKFIKEKLSHMQRLKKKS